MDNQSKAEDKVMGVTPRSNLYAHAAKNGKEVIDFLLKTMRDEKAQISVRVSCANKIIDKLLSNRNTVEGDRENPLEVKIETQYTPEQAEIIRNGVAEIVKKISLPPDHVHDQRCDPLIDPKVCEFRG